MKKTDIDNLRKMNTSDLSRKEREMRGQLADLVIDRSMSKISDKKAILKKRRERAVVLTILRQKKLLEELEEKREGEVNKV